MFYTNPTLNWPRNPKKVAVLRSYGALMKTKSLLKQLYNQAFGDLSFSR